MWPGRLVKTTKLAGLNWAGLNDTGFSGTEPRAAQFQRDPASLRMNTSMGPNAVCADRSANTAGSVTWASRASAAYRDRHCVVAPADVSATARYPGHRTKANSTSEGDRVTGDAAGPSTARTSASIGSTGNQLTRVRGGSN